MMDKKGLNCLDKSAMIKWVDQDARVDAVDGSGESLGEPRSPALRDWKRIGPCEMPLVYVE
jgi:hypothetical protein